MARFGVQVSSPRSYRVRTTFGSLLILSCLVVFHNTSAAQTYGVQLFSTNDFGIDLATSAVNISIPIRAKAGKIPYSGAMRGTSLYYAADVGAPPYQWFLGSAWIVPPGVYKGWMSYSDNLTPHIFGTITPVCEDNLKFSFLWTNITVQDNTGASHPFPGFSYDTGTQCPTAHAAATAADGSGFSILVTNGVAVIYDRSGNSYSTQALVMTDADGSTISENNANAITDTLGATVATLSKNSSSQVTCVAYPATGATSTCGVGPAGYTISYKVLTIATDFGCTTSPYGPITEASGQQSLPTSITTPTDDTYTINYEFTPGSTTTYTGRIAEIIYPTGGSISYSYSDTGGHHGMNCQSFVVPTITVKVSDNVSGDPVRQWTYTNSATTFGQTSFTVTETDAAGDTIIHTFAGEYETERTIKDVSLGLLKTIITCYNNTFPTGGAAKCATASPPSLPITQTDVYTTVGSSASLVETKFDRVSGVVTEAKSYDFGAPYPPSGTPLSDTAIVYNTGSSCGTVNQYVLDRACSITVTAPTGQVSQTKSTYSAGGHPTQTQRWVSGSGKSAVYLTSTAVYGPVGNNNAGQGVLSSVTDANGGTTSFTAFACNGVLPTAITYPVSSSTNLSASQTWDCNGAVLTGKVGVDGQPWTYQYSDPLWRMTSSTDPESNSTNFYYSVPTTVEGILTFGSSTVDNLTTTDGLGRPIYSQRKQGPSASTYDTVQTSYDALGRRSVITTPCSAIAGKGCAGSNVTTVYDAIGRPESQQDSFGGLTTYTYPMGQDTLQVRSSTSGGQTFQKQFEYDGLGRLTSVCEITSSANGGNACGQASPQTGYLTQYSYPALQNVVTQNANGSPTQTRTFNYDGLARLTSEMNPESGTTTYFWDAAPGPCYNNVGWSTPGDLGAREDNMGVYNCYGYDLLHRRTGTLTNPSGPCNGFVYDSATPPKNSGITVSNTAGHIVEAYTSNCSTSLITDEWFSYSSRGEISDTYSSTPNSNGYYHLSKLYWPNGAVEQMSGLPGLPNVTYNLDGEGRWYSVSDTNTSLVTQTKYSPANEVTQATFGTGDSDIYGYDAMNREDSFTFNVNGGEMAGSPTWNANATLGTFQITQDTFNSANIQSCSYGYDDLARIQSVTCTSPETQQTIWSQTFAADPFGNIKKTGNTSFQPTYATNNQYSTIPGCTGLKYDADGHPLDDSFHSYQWDNYGHVAFLSASTCVPQISPFSSTQTFDAFGRIVEISQADPSWLGQYLYDTDGTLLGTSHAQSAASLDIPLPGGSKASYSGGAVQHYRHADWLGTMRFDSNVNRTMFADVARAPYGEEYAVSGPPFEPFAQLTQSIAGDLFDTNNREYHLTQGRWISPDPAGPLAVDTTNPQTWNRYAYVANNPVNFTDPSGLVLHDCFWEGGCNGNMESGGGGDGSGGFGGASGNYGGGINSTSGITTGLTYVDNSPLLALQGASSESRYVSIISTGWDPAFGVQYTDVAGRPYQAVLIGMYCPNGICGNISETSQTVTWQYEIVDYNGNPVENQEFPMAELLLPLFGNANMPGATSWLQQPTASDPSGSFFIDYIGGQGNFTSSTNGFYIGLQQFDVTWGGSTYGLTTQVIQVTQIQNGMLTTAQPFILAP